MYPKDLMKQIQMDEVASFSVTESKFAEDISKQILNTKFLKIIFPLFV